MSEEVRTALERAELEDPGETLRFPLSMGEMRLDQDHKGQACHVLDIVFNIDVLKQAETFRWVQVFDACICILLNGICMRPFPLALVLCAACMSLPLLFLF